MRITLVTGEILEGPVDELKKYMGDNIVKKSHHKIVKPVYQAKIIKKRHNKKEMKQLLKDAKLKRLVTEGITIPDLADALHIKYATAHILSKRLREDRDIILKNNKFYALVRDKIKRTYIRREQ
jgi:hypothetical protein